MDATDTKRYYWGGADDDHLATCDCGVRGLCTTSPTTPCKYVLSLTDLLMNTPDCFFLVNEYVVLINSCDGHAGMGPR